MALRDGIAKARPVLLEPVMKLEVVSPEEFLGDIISNLNSMRGQIENIETHGKLSTIRALVPLAETFGYATSLRSLTQGRATHVMEFYRYQELPTELADQVIYKVRGRGYG